MLFERKDALKRLFLRPEKHATSTPPLPILLPDRHITRRTIKALCIYFCCLTSLPAFGAAVCPAVNYDETTEIKYIVDGDTLYLKNGSKVRLIGINTPESARDNRAAEAFSAQATNALNTLFTHNDSISLVYGKDKYDRYKRLLAHGFTANGENIQATLLAQGYARTITFPPNTAFTDCYQQLERIARCNKAGLWKKYKPLLARKLNDMHIGFQLVKGKLNSINIDKKGIWLNLDNKLLIGIRPDNQSLFDINVLYKWLNKKIVVRGWLNKNKKANATASPYYIRIRHPSAIESAATFACD